MPIAAADVDVIEAGSGPLVVLVHSSVSGARQWRRLIELLAPSFHVKAVNLYGYGNTPGWRAERRQTLADQAALVEAVVAAEDEDIALVGHSLGGSVAMTTASRLGRRVSRLVLLEPNPFQLLAEHGRAAAYAEISALSITIKARVAESGWDAAAYIIADYWGGAGTWAGMSPERRAAFAEVLPHNLHEWDAVLGDRVPLARWVAEMPARTLVVWDPATVRPIREIVELMQAGTPWSFEALPKGGHMAPLTHPELVNPIVARFLAA